MKEVPEAIRRRAAKLRLLSNEEIREMALAEDPSEFDQFCKAVRTVAGHIEEDARE